MVQQALFAKLHQLRQMQCLWQRRRRIAPNFLGVPYRRMRRSHETMVKTRFLFETGF